MKYINNWHTYLNEGRKPKEIQEPEEFPENALHFLSAGNEIGNSMIAVQMINYKYDSPILQGWLVWLKRVLNEFGEKDIKFYFKSQKPLTALLEMIQWLQGKKIKGPVLQKYAEIVLNLFGFCDGDYFYPPAITHTSQNIIYYKLLDSLLDENGLIYKIYPNNNFKLEYYCIQCKYLKSFKNTETFENISFEILAINGDNTNIIQDLSWIGPNVESLHLDNVSIKNLKGCPPVDIIGLRECKIESLTGINKNISNVVIQYCPLLKNLNGLENLNLTKLNLENLNIESLEGCPQQIDELVISECNNITSLIGVPKKLEILKVFNFKLGYGLIDIGVYPHSISKICKLEFNINIDKNKFKNLWPELKKYYPSADIQLNIREK